MGLLSSFTYLSQMFLKNKREYLQKKKILFLIKREEYFLLGCQTSADFRAREGVRPHGQEQSRAVRLLPQSTAASCPTGSIVMWNLSHSKDLGKKYLSWFFYYAFSLKSNSSVKLRKQNSLKKCSAEPWVKVCISSLIVAKWGWVFSYIYYWIWGFFSSF